MKVTKLFQFTREVIDLNIDISLLKPNNIFRQMKTNKFSILLLGAILSIVPAAARAQNLQGSTLNTASSSGTLAAATSATMFPVISPTCPYDQMALFQLLSIAQSANPTAYNAALFLLLSGAFTPDAVRNALVTQLCTGPNAGNP